MKLIISSQGANQDELTNESSTDDDETPDGIDPDDNDDKVGADGLRDKHRDGAPARHKTKQELTLDVDLMFEDPTTVRFKTAGGTEEIYGHWCRVCR